MKVLIIQSRDSDIDLYPKIKEAVEGKVAPLEIECKYVNFFFELPQAMGKADIVIAFLFPRKEYGPIAAEVFRELAERGAKVLFDWYENAPSSEDEFVTRAVSYILG